MNCGVLEFVEVCSPAKKLLAGFGVLVPNMFVAGADVAGSAGFGVAAPPKLNEFAEGVAAAVIEVLSELCVLVWPKLNKFFCGVAVSSVFSLFCSVPPAANPPKAGVATEVALFCASAPAPKPPNVGAAAGVALFCVAPPKLNMLEAGAGVLVLAGVAELVAPNWNVEVLVAAGVAVVFAPKKDGCEAGAGAGVLGAAAADELAPPNANLGVDAPFVVPNMLGDPDELLVLFCWAPPKGLLADWLPNIEPPNDVGAPFPFVVAALPFRPPKGLFVDDAGEKSKPLPEGA